MQTVEVEADMTVHILELLLFCKNTADTNIEAVVLRLILPYMYCCCCCEGD